MVLKQKNKCVLVVCPNPSVDIFAWISDFVAGETNRIENEKRYPGGKGVHVAMALSELQTDVILLGFWGSVTGTWIKNECIKYYPDISCIGPTLTDWSRSCYTFKSDGKYNDSELLGTGPQLTPENINDFHKIFNENLASVKAVVLSGSWPTGSTNDNYAQMISDAKEQNTPAFVDCTGIQLENALKERPYFIHLNRTEILSFSGENNLQKAQRKLSNLCTTSAITDGANGVYYHNGQDDFHSLAKIENVYSTIGSGDCLLAGFVAGYINSLSDQSLANYGAACGAANCLRHELGMLRKADVENLLVEM